jgi:DNA-directed RNA polymerase subunit RPC12/RpoP
MTSYMTKRDAVLKDPAASFWLKTAISALERRDPVDAFNDAEALRKIAFVRMETAFRSPDFGAGADYHCARCGNAVMTDPQREDMQIKTRLCTGCWLRACEELRERRMGRAA